ncbi:ATP-dependent DNA helicase RecQ [Barrientosiimonas marina]|uniref:RecQ family ATP-dependent DNA helicase n=1 Tax=Lentibacillus kimchii TaxID=1542911 RepID=A0ABW2UY33_9BACI
MGHLNLKDQLKQQFRLNEFRTGQEEIMTDVLRGRDVLGILPTGSGKSLCYQLPATLLEGLTVVVSPLISLMEDQVKELKAMGFKQAAALNSFMHPIEKKRVLQQLDSYKLIYLSPELLQQNEVIRPLEHVTVDMFVIDEAHCISQWGHEFRPDYLRLSNVLQQLKDPVVLALSATATKDVQQDITTVLNRPEMIRHTYPMDRDNIAFMVQDLNGDREKQKYLADLFEHYRVPTLIYFSSRRKTEEITMFLSDNFPSYRIAFYHGGMDQLDRVTVQQQFMNEQLDIICCTSAFGMGINKQNIRLVIHYHFPLQLESFLQEIGRAGRDGQSSVSLLLYSPGDDVIPRSIIENELPTIEDLDHLVKNVYALYSDQTQLPSEEQLLEALQINETQWRFLRYQMEQHSMIEQNQLLRQSENKDEAIRKIRQFIEKRTTLKEQKLQDMLSWIHEDTCLRESLYCRFQDDYKEPLYGCCSNCGFSFDQWNPVQTQSDDTSFKWETKLKKLLLIGEYSGETK